MATVYCVKLANDGRIGLSDGEWAEDLNTAKLIAERLQRQYKSLQVVIEQVERTGQDFKVINPDVLGQNIVF